MAAAGRIVLTEKLYQVRELVNQAAAAGFKGIRFAIEMTWVLGPDIPAAKLEHWEATLNNLFTPAFPGRMICQYNRSRLGPQVLLAGLHTHPQTVFGEEVCANPFYEAPLILDGDGNNHCDDRTSAAKVEWIIGQIRGGRAAEKQREELIA